METGWVVDGLRLCALCRKRKKGLSVGEVWGMGKLGK
jgi:hypothetical protein